VTDVETPQSAPGVRTSAADERLRGLIGDRFDALMVASPSYASYIGIHEHDGSLGDLSREAKEADIVAEQDFVAALEAVDVDSLSPRDDFERDLALHSARLRLFDAEVRRDWERRLGATEEIGDGLFVLLARETAPLRERLAPMAERLEAVPTALQQVRDRLGNQPVRLWNEVEVASARELPSLIDEIVSAGRTGWADETTRLAALERAALAAQESLAAYGAWLEAQLPHSVDDFALGSTELDHLIELRAFDGLDTQDILAIGLEQLEVQHEARREAGRHIDPDADEAEIVDRIKHEGPADFDAALSAYRKSMARARAFVAEHGLATLPTEEVLDVVPTPNYLRGVIPFAAYFQPPVFDRPSRGIYIVTPSVDGDPRAMLEHNWSSIVNTSIHEAYPGHHQQLTSAASSATPSRLLVNAPEFVEGWGMYCEQMMLEHGFEDTPPRRVMVATDAIWRAARIVLDIRLQRREIDVPDAIDFLVEHTGFERPNAVAEVHRYTRVPAYNLSYLLGKVLLLRLRDDERRRLAERFSLRDYHDALLYSGSLPISFQRRLLLGEGGGPTRPGSPLVA
jgi:uncharacterized protein (DUF885 family)